MKALKGVEEMRKNVDSLLIINNESICDVYADSELSIKDAFKVCGQYPVQCRKEYIGADYD